MTDLSGHRSRHGIGYDDHGVRDAVRGGLGFAAAGLLFLITASLWMGTCTGSTIDAVASEDAVDVRDQESAAERDKRLLRLSVGKGLIDEATAKRAWAAARFRV